MRHQPTSTSLLTVVATVIVVSGYVGRSVVNDIAADRTKAHSFDGTDLPLTNIGSDSQTVLNRSVSRGRDDAEEKASGAMRRYGADLELVEDDSLQNVGLRFQNIWIPRGSTITEAKIQFRVDETSSSATSLELFGDLIGDAKPFYSSDYNITNRPLTSASVTWNPPAWNTVGAAGPDQRTPNLAPIIQEIVNQQAWVSGNSIAIIITGTGRRVAESYDGTFAPELEVVYENSDPDPVYADTFACLDDASDIVVVNVQNWTGKYEPDTAQGRVFDARNATFSISESPHGIIQLDGPSSHTGMFWAGGYVEGDKPWDASWDEWKYDPETRNSNVFKFDTPAATLTGLHFFNVHDGPRIGSAGAGWTVQHVWGEYIRDDAIENDHLHSGRILDSLFDGCYSGISTRASDSDNSSDGEGELVTLNGVLLRLEAMPYPYDYQNRSGVIDENGDVWDGSGIPYGHGNLFKDDRDDVNRNPHFVIKNCVFLLPNEHARRSSISFPPDGLIDECSNVTVIWLGDGEFPGDLPTNKFPNGVTVLYGQQGLDFWRDKVIDWHQRHPDVDPTRKPVSPGVIFD